MQYCLLQYNSNYTKNVGLLPYVIKAHHKPTYKWSSPTNIAGTQSRFIARVHFEVVILMTLSKYFQMS